MIFFFFNYIQLDYKPEKRSMSYIRLFMNKKYSYCHPSTRMQEILRIICRFFHVRMLHLKRIALDILILCFHRCPKCSPVFSNRCARMSLSECGWTSCMLPVKLQYYWWDRVSWIPGWVHGILEIFNQGLRGQIKTNLAFLAFWF